MALRLEDYALIGDRHSAALVGVDGSIDWLCLPRFDAPACFAALLGTPEHGQWALTPTDQVRPAGRRYRPDSLVLETDLTTGTGTVRITDCMPARSDTAQVIRIVEALDGRVQVHSRVVLAFDYGSRPPLWRRQHGRLHAVAGPDGVSLDGDVRHEIRDGVAQATFHVEPGRNVALRMSWHGLANADKPGRDPHVLVEQTDRWWRTWAAHCSYQGDYREAVIRSLLTLKALTYAPSGGMVAAATTSLPEQLGGARNWDYRYCWVRDATFTLLALLESGYVKEAQAWREWLLRALAGDPARLQIMYGVAGESRLPETELDLPGYADSRPVRVGNAASEQFQLDAYGDLMDSLHQGREHDLTPDEDAWHAQTALMDVLESRWTEPDHGIWEVRGAPRHFVYSKVMAWTAADRAIAAVERSGLAGPLDRWKQLRTDIHTQVCSDGFDTSRHTFTQSYGSTALDAAVLLMPAVGFLPARDPRIAGTVKAVEKHLLQDGFVQRYNAQGSGRVDDLPAGEGAFLPCTFWLADAHAMAGRKGRARQLYEKLLDLRNDVGLLTEEYDTTQQRLVGNLPQALTHVAVVNTAFGLQGGGASRRRSASRSRSRS